MPLRTRGPWTPTLAWALLWAMWACASPTPEAAPAAAAAVDADAAPSLDLSTTLDGAADSAISDGGGDDGGDGDADSDGDADGDGDAAPLSDLGSLPDAALVDAAFADATAPGDAAPAADAGLDAAIVDASPADAALADAIKADATKADVPLADANLADATKADAALADANLTDATLTDATKADAALSDAAPADAIPTDTSKADAAQADAASGDALTDSAPSYNPGSCKKPGAEACGKGIGGDPAMLYVCSAKLKWQPLQTCKQPCEAMPAGVPDRCPEDLAVPGALVTTLDVKPYIEQACKPTSYKGWPYPAKSCSYTQLGLTTTVITATPAAEVVAAWIVDATAFMPSVWALRYRDATAYKKALKMVANAVLLQSSRIFPLEGGIIEQMTGTSATIYNFYHGVTQGCSTGCFCRINSLQKDGWCAYQNFLGAQGLSACLSAMGATGLTKAWGDQCLNNHIAAWKSTVNHHFRARAHQMNQGIKAACATAVACTPSQVLAALQQAL